MNVIKSTASSSRQTKSQVVDLVRLWPRGFASSIAKSRLVAAIKQGLRHFGTAYETSNRLVLASLGNSSGRATREVGIQTFSSTFSGTVSSL